MTENTTPTREVGVTELALRAAHRAAAAGLLPEHAAKDVLSTLEDPA